MDREKIEAFWNWFEENKESRDRLLEEVNQKIKEVSKGLFVELNEGKMIITPHGVKEYFADAYELVMYAPTIEGWEFIATKPPFKVDVRGVTFMPLLSDEHPEDIAIRIYDREYSSDDTQRQNVTIAKLYRLLDGLLGEESVAFDFQYIDFDDMPHPKEQDYPLEQLPSFVEHKKAQRKIANQKFPKEEIELLEGKVEGLTSQLILNRALKYYAFTKLFPYFFRFTINYSNYGENGLPTGDSNELFLLEDMVYGEIYKQKKGHFIATETYNAKRELFYYVESKESIDNLVEKLPKDLQHCNWHYEVEYDPFWILMEEYIYM